MIDVISPCVTFNDHEGSTKSYSYVKDHEEPLSDVSFVPFFEDINVEYDAGTTTAVTLHNGSKILLSKLAEDYHPTDKMSALRLLHETRARGEYATGSSTSSPTSRTSWSCSASWTSRSRRCPSRGRDPARRRSTRSWRASGNHADPALTWIASRIE